MPSFHYQAFDAQGQTVSGTLTAPDEATVRARVREQGLFPTEVALRQEASVGPLLGGGSVSDRDLGATTRLMGTLMGAGFPVVDALDTLVAQTAHPRMRQVLDDVRARVREGAKLSGALSTHDDVFPELYVHMVRAGEASAALEVVLSELADYLEVRSKVRNKLRAALAYPAVMTATGLIIVGFLVAWVVPTMADLLRSGGQELPLITKVLMFLGDLMLNWWWTFPFLVGGAVMGARVALATEGGRRAADAWTLQIPGLGSLVLKMSMARFARLFGVLLRAGVPILTALEIVREVVDNVLLREVLVKARDEVERGAVLADPLRASGLFPPLVCDMVAAGQRSGRLTETLDRLSQGYDAEVESAIETFLALLEPALILVMAGAVSFVVAGVLLPIFEMNNAGGF